MTSFRARALKPEQVRKLRLERDTACECCGLMPTLDILARRYGVSRIAVHKICTGETYRDVTSE